MLPSIFKGLYSQSQVVIVVAAPLTPDPFPPRKRRERGEQSFVGEMKVFRKMGFALNEANLRSQKLIADW